MQRKILLALGAVLGVLLLFFAFTMGNGAPQNVYAAAPTPVAGAILGSPNAQNAVWFSQLALTANRNSRSVNLGDYSKADVQVVLDHTATNATTLKLQFSNDGVNWIDGATIGSALDTDTNTMQQYAIFGRYARVSATVTSTNPVTVTVLGLAK